MPDFDMWGPSQDGFNIGVQDTQKQQLNQITLQQEQQKAAKQQQDQQRMQDLLMRDQNKNALELSQDMIREGHLEEGRKLMAVSSQAMQHLATADKEKVETQIKRQENNLKSIKYIGGQVDNIHSQDDYDRFIQQIEPTLGTKLPAEIKNAKWSPEYKQRLQTLGMTWKDKADLQLKKHKQELEAQNKDVEGRLKEAQIVKEQAQTKEIRARTENIGKTQGKTSRVNKEDMQQVNDLLSTEFPDEKDSSTKANAAYTIASRAEKLVQQNKGMDRATAIQKSYNEAKRNGELKSLTESHFFGLSSKQKMSFENKGGEQSKDLAAPQQAKEQFLKSHPKADLPAAEAYLQKHPEYKDKFKETFGYLPADSSDDEN